MQLTINGQPQTFISIQTFRSQWNLPDEFQTDYFEPKDWEGLGSMKGAHDALAQMRREVLATVPETITPLNILSTVDLLTTSYRYQLEKANEQMELRQHDVGFAVAGFEDVMAKITAVAEKRVAKEGKLVMTKVVGGFIATK